MKQASPFNYVQPAMNIPSERNTIVYMRENIKELNRSMENIEKMIERSRSIIRSSRNSSLNQKQGHRLNLTQPTIDSFIKLEDNQRSPLKTEPVNEQVINSTQRKSNLSTNSKLITHVISPLQVNVSSALNIAKATSKCNSKLGATHRKEVCQAEARIGNIPINRLNQTAIIKQRLISMSKSIQKLQKQSPFKQIHNRDRRVYQFSPEKGNKNEAAKSTNRLNVKLAPSNLEKHPKIKIKTTHNYTNSSQSIRPQTAKREINLFPAEKNQKSNDMIRIEDDQQQDQDNKSTADIEIKYPETEVKPRHKTDHEDEEERDLSYDFKISQPDNKTTAKKQMARKINLKGPQNGDTNKKVALNSESQVKKGEASMASNRNNLVKQLEELQSISENDQERRGKFLMKIKKYGFVDKYLTEAQIWGLYDELTQSKISQLKWPIVIVDEVYKKMKVSK